MQASAKVADTLCQALRAQAETRGGAPAILGDDTQLSWRELEQRVGSTAGALRRSGVVAGDIVGMVLPRTPELVVVFLAIVRLGAVVVPINHRLRPRGLRAQVGGLGWVVVDRRLVNEDMVPNLGRATLLGVDDLSKAERASPYVEGQSKPDDVCYLNCTSGSTGHPRRAATTHAQILANAYATTAASSLTDEHTFLCLFAPFAHPHEFLHRALVSGAATVLVEARSPRAVAQSIARWGVTHMLVLPGFAEMWLDHGVGPVERSLLQEVEAGGAVVSAELHRRMQNALDGDFVAVWGSTETTGVALRSTGEGGIVLSGYTLAVMNEDGQEVSAGEVGELWVRGPAVVSRYWSAQGTEPGPFQSGWFISGDLVRRDSLGRIHHLGRRSSMLKVAGERVFPAEIEAVISALEYVREVVVVGTADRLRGEAPAAVVVTVDGERDGGAIQAHCRRVLEHYKVPRLVTFWPELPRLPGGKVDRAEVARRLN